MEELHRKLVLFYKEQNLQMRVFTDVPGESLETGQTREQAKRLYPIPTIDELHSICKELNKLLSEAVYGAKFRIEEIRIFKE